MRFGEVFSKLTLSVVLFMGLVSPAALAVDNVTYVHNDALGSPIVATNAAGDIKWRESYKPSGERIVDEANSPKNAPWFTGKSEEAALGLQYFGARWYHPEAGRFMSIDPVGFFDTNPVSFNRYAYANNNSYRYVDPDGRQAEALSIAHTRMILGNGSPEEIQRNLDAHARGTLVGVALVGTWYAGAWAAPAVLAAENGVPLPGLSFRSAGNVTMRGVQANRAQGKAGEAITEATLRQNGSFAGKQVTFETSTGQRSVIDFVINTRGGKGIVETKTGGARLTSGQYQLFDDVRSGRPVIPRGQNAASAGLTPGRPTVLKSCRVDYPC